MTLRHNGKIATQDDRRSIVEALVIRDGKFLAVGSDREVMRFRDQETKLTYALFFRSAWFLDPRTHTSSSGARNE